MSVFSDFIELNLIVSEITEPIKQTFFYIYSCRGICKSALQVSEYISTSLVFSTKKSQHMFSFNPHTLNFSHF